MLSSSGRPGRARVASYLLDCDDSGRINIAENLYKILANQKIKQTPLPFSTYGDIKLTIFCWQDPLIPRNKELAIDHTRAAMLVAGDNERLMLELFFTDEERLEAVKWINVTLSDILHSDLERLNNIAETLRTKRLKKAGKIGRNVLCPCGSGKKYKKCCLRLQ